MAHFSGPHHARAGCAADASVSRPSTHATLSCNHPPALTVADGRDDPLAELFLGVSGVSPASLTAVWSMRGCAGSHASSFFAARPPWCEPVAGAAGRLTRPAPSHRTCVRPSVAWSRCAAPIDTLVSVTVTVQHRLGGSSTHWVMLAEQCDQPSSNPPVRTLTASDRSGQLNEQTSSTQRRRSSE